MKFLSQTKPPKPKGTFYVMDLENQAVLFQSNDWDEACQYAKDKVASVNDRFAILTEMVRTTWKVEVTK